MNQLPRLFAFHHAGGSTTAFAGWSRALAGRMDVIAVDLPGRDGHRDLRSLAEAVIAKYQFHGEYLFYGHSMGALVAYRVARALVERDGAGPKRLMVGAFPAPHLAHRLGAVHRLPDPELARWLLSVSDIPVTLLEDWRLARAVDRLRADLRLCETHDRAAPVTPLPCPIDVFAGVGDQLVRVEDAKAWTRYTKRSCELYRVPGGHFFPREQRGSFFQAFDQAINS